MLLLNLVPTEKGLAVYHIVKDKRIADIEMTGQWETALTRIEAGGISRCYTHKLRK
jgi:DNA topoisomerase III